VSGGKSGETQVSPDFPDFTEIAVPDESFLRKIRGDGTDSWERRAGSHAYRGRIQPFDLVSDAQAVARMLKGNVAIDVHGGYLLPDRRAETLAEVVLDPSLYDLTTTFDVLVLAFDHTPDLWAFSLNPAISRVEFPDHPHLRSDRKVIWSGQELHGLCIYSAAEFSIARQRSPLDTFLRQVSIFLAKTVLRLAAPAKTWLGNVALSGNAHLSHDINGPCWCGDGKTYRKCCLPGEVLRLLRTVRRITIPEGFELRF
jgi:hypothetical protein